MRVGHCALRWDHAAEHKRFWLALLLRTARHVRGRVRALHVDGCKAQLLTQACLKCRWSFQRATRWLAAAAGRWSSAAHAPSSGSFGTSTRQVLLCGKCSISIVLCTLQVQPTESWLQAVSTPYRYPVCRPHMRTATATKAKKEVQACLWLQQPASHRWHQGPALQPAAGQQALAATSLQAQAFLMAAWLCRPVVRTGLPRGSAQVGQLAVALVQRPPRSTTWRSGRSGCCPVMASIRRPMVGTE